MGVRGVSVLVVLLRACLLTAGDNTTGLRFSPDSGVRLTGEETVSVQVTGRSVHTTLTHVRLTISDDQVARILTNVSVPVTPTDCAAWNVSEEESATATLGGYCFTFNFTVQGVFLGRTQVFFYDGEIPEQSEKLPIPYDVVVLRTKNALADIFTYTVIAIVAINTIGFGCSIDLSEMAKILKKPIPPAIGLGCQFILNPVIAYGLGKAFDLRLALALGLFSVGCSPGGGSSNMWTYLLDGDLNLSILMTFISTCVAFGMLPLWMYTLGRTLIPENIEIPFTNIFISLVSLVVPCAIGVLIRKVAPKTAKFIRKSIKPVALVAILLSLSVGIYSNLYMFEVMKDWRVLTCGISTPYSAYVSSAVVAWLCRQPRARILTIAIETGIQNTAIAIVLILTTFPEPEADLAAVMPVATVMFTPFPLLILLIIKIVRKRCCKSDIAKKSPLSSVDTESMTSTPTKEKPSHVNGKINESFDDVIASGEKNKQESSTV